MLIDDKIQQKNLEYINLENFLSIFSSSLFGEECNITKALPEFLVILDEEIPLRYSERGYGNDDQFAFKGDVKYALLKVQRGIATLDQIVQTQDGHDVSLGKLLIKRSDIIKAYSEGGETRYPWSVSLPQNPSDWAWFPLGENLKPKSWSMSYEKAKFSLDRIFKERKEELPTNEEILRWIETRELRPINKWFRPDVDGTKKKIHYWDFSALSDGELRKELGFLFFDEDEITNFIPKTRWLTFERVCGRWAQYGKTALDTAALLKSEKRAAPEDFVIMDGGKTNWYLYLKDEIQHIELEHFSSNPQAEVVVNDDEGSGTTTERQSQLYIFIWRVHQFLSQKMKPTAQQLWNEIKHRHENHDTEKIIQEVDCEQILWCSGYGNEQRLQRISFDKTLSNLRKNPPF